MASTPVTAGIREAVLARPRAIGAQKAFWLAVYFLSPLIPLSTYFAGNWYTFFHSWSLAMTAGITAYVYMLNQFILGARPRIWDRVFGLGAVLRFHGTMAVVSLGLLTLHMALKNFYLFAYNAQVRLGQVAFTLFALIIVLTVLLMVENILHKVEPLAALKRFSANRLRLRYQHLRLIHNFTAVAALLALFHVLLASSTREQPLRGAVMATWFILALGFYAYHKLVRPALTRRKAAGVSAVRKDAEGIYTIELEGSHIEHRAGQFAYFRFLDGRPSREEHPYTISSSPSAERLSFSAKASGDWSSRLSEVQPGDRVAVDGPYGTFSYLRVDENAPLVFLAGGIGITPYLSMLRYAAEAGSARSIHLVWGVRKAEELCYLSELEGLKGRLPGLTVTPVVSRDASFTGRRGRIDADLLRQLGLLGSRVEKEARTLEAHWFLCGPTSMMEDLLKVLRKAGIRRRKIHFERFTM
jgi:predicted ferric reductase